MRRNGYLWTSGVNLDTAVRFADPNFLLGCKISGIWRRFPLIFLHFICWMFALFLLPVFLTYWPRKYITRVDPHVDNSHQVWSWYDHPSYSVFVCRHFTWPCYLDLWPFDLEQLSYMAGHVTNLATNLEDPMPIRSWFMRYNVSHDYHRKFVRGHCACAESRDPWVGGSKTIIFLESPTPICLFTIQLLSGYDDH